MQYKDASAPVISNFNFELMQGERVILDWDNGGGKSSFIKAVLGVGKELFDTKGIMSIASGLVISYISQDTSHLRGSLQEYAKENKLDYALFLSLLRQLDFSREQFAKRMEEFSEGQKKKVLIAGSLLTPAHLYIWDEPLNYIDVFSRMQIEKLILTYSPTMLLVEHDARFKDKIATVQCRR